MNLFGLLLISPPRDGIRFSEIQESVLVRVLQRLPRDLAQQIHPHHKQDQCAPDRRDLRAHSGTREAKECLTINQESVTLSVQALSNDYKDRAVLYDLEGAKGAKTTVKLRTGEERHFRTYQQMHSEMRAIEVMLEERKWILYCGTVVWPDRSNIEADEFVTMEPHCGF